jgi:hypothetical protein
MYLLPLHLPCLVVPPPKLHFCLPLRFPASSVAFLQLETATRVVLLIRVLFREPNHFFLPSCFPPAYAPVYSISLLSFSCPMLDANQKGKRMNKTSCQEIASCFSEIQFYNLHSTTTAIVLHNSWPLAELSSCVATLLCVSQDLFIGY